MSKITVPVSGKIENIIPPRQGDAGWDLVADSISVKNNYIEYGTGVHLAIPEGWFGAIYPRNSISNTCLDLCNSVGVIDPYYRGEIKFRFRATTDNWHVVVKYQIGDRIGQIVFQQYELPLLVPTETLPESARQLGGFGSTGK